MTTNTAKLEQTVRVSKSMAGLPTLPKEVVDLENQVRELPKRSNLVYQAWVWLNKRIAILSGYEKAKIELEDAMIKFELNKTTYEIAKLEYERILHAEYGRVLKAIEHEGELHHKKPTCKRLIAAPHQLIKAFW